MKEVRTEILINSGKRAVWDTLSNFAAYPEWNPSLVEVRTELVTGARVDLTFRGSRRAMQLNAEIIAARPGEELRWVGPASRPLRILFRGEHYFVIQETPDGATRFVHGERFSGLLVPFMARWLDREIAPAYDAMNRALKVRAEAVDTRAQRA